MLKLSDLQNTFWEPKTGLDINDPIAENYKIAQQNNALSLVMCSSVPYSGWLAKHVEPMYYEAQSMRFRYSLMIDDATLFCAQVAETDTKNTDSEGYTYDLSAQWNIANDWMFQVDNADWRWMDTGIQIPPLEPYSIYEIEIEHRLDFKGKRSAIPAVWVDTQRYEVPNGPLWIPAKQTGWEPKQIVFQLQQCINSQVTGGGYTLRFSGIEYELD